MNAHNEQHVIEQIAQQWDGCMYDSVGETIDIGDAIRAAGKRLSSQPAAAQEAVAWPNECSRTVPEALRFLANHERPSGGEDRFNSLHLIQLAGEIERMASKPLYAAPVTAAPANDLHAHLLHMLGAKDHEDAGRIIGELHAAASPKGGSDWEATDADIAAWQQRHDLAGAFGSKTDARAAFEDARSAEHAAGDAEVQP